MNEIEIGREETLEALVNRQRAQIEELTVQNVQLELAVRKLNEELNKGADENASQESQD